jgi:hypothetical protein
MPARSHLRHRSRRRAQGDGRPLGPVPVVAPFPKYDPASRATTEILPSRGECRQAQLGWATGAPVATGPEPATGRARITCAAIRSAERTPDVATLRFSMTELIVYPVGF